MRVKVRMVVVGRVMDFSAGEEMDLECLAASETVVQMGLLFRDLERRLEPLPPWV